MYTHACTHARTLDVLTKPLISIVKKMEKTGLGKLE